MRSSRSATPARPSSVSSSPNTSTTTIHCSASTRDGRSRRSTEDALPDRNRARRLRDIERWIAWIRLGAIPFAVFQVWLTNGYPNGYELRAWLSTAALAVGAAGFFVLARRDLSPRA